MAMAIEWAEIGIRCVRRDGQMGSALSLQSCAGSILRQSLFAIHPTTPIPSIAVEGSLGRNAFGRLAFRDRVQRISMNQKCEAALVAVHEFDVFVIKLGLHGSFNCVHTSCGGMWLACSRANAARSASPSGG